MFPNPLPINDDAWQPWAYAPTFAHDGAWLYFISDRNFAPQPGAPWADRNMSVAFPERGEAYGLQLDPEAGFRMREDNELTRAAKPDGSGLASTNMQNAYRGHVVMLIGERTYSDGESFAAAVRALGIAPLVGTR